MTDLASTLEAAFAHWKCTGEIDPELQIGGSESANDRFAESPERMLFASTLFLARANLDASARMFARAFATCPDLLFGCDEADQLDTIAGLMSPSSSLPAIMISADPADGIKRLLLHRQSNAQRVAREYDALAARQTFPCTLQQASLYCYTKIVEGGKPFKEEYLVHKALFWALAGWARWKAAPLTRETPKRKSDGPWFEEIIDLLKQFCDVTAPPIEAIDDADVQRVLDSAIAHVRGLGGWKAACDETHFEPLWIITPDGKPMSTIVRVYSTRDATGSIRRIFPWIFAESPVLVGGSAEAVARDAAGSAVPDGSSSAAAGGSASTPASDAASALDAAAETSAGAPVAGSASAALADPATREKSADSKSPRPSPASNAVRQ